MKPIALMIDGANIHATARALGIDIDYRAVLKHFGGADILRAFYFTAIAGAAGEFNTLRPLVDWLGYNGYTVVSRPTKEFTDQEGRRKVKGNMDVEIAVATMEIAPHISRLVLFSGDGDFRSLVESVQRQGIHVTVVSSIMTKPAAITDELRRQADVFIDLDGIREVIGRDAAAPSSTRSSKPIAGRAYLDRLPTNFAKSPATAPTS